MEIPSTSVPASASRILAIASARVDTHIHAGYKVSPYYDSLIAKLIVHAPTRA
ncbi:acetyl-CoA carboxylase biotin carboxylase subunit, partial [Rhizobium johnstonii]